MSEIAVSYHMKTNDAAAVVQAAKEIISSRAYVSPEKNGWVSLYDKLSETPDPREIDRIAHDLTVRITGGLFTFVLHDGMFVYHLFDDGDLRDEYSSDPSYFGGLVSEEERKRWAGRPTVVAGYCAPGKQPADVEAALGRGHLLREGGFGAAVSAEARRRMMADLLGIDPARSILTFSSVEGKQATLEDGDKFVRIDGKRAQPPWRGPIPPRMPTKNPPK